MVSVFGQGAVGSRAVVNMAPVWGRANKHPDTDSQTGYRLSAPLYLYIWYINKWNQRISTQNWLLNRHPAIVGIWTFDKVGLVKQICESRPKQRQYLFCGSLPSNISVSRLLSYLYPIIWSSWAFENNLNPKHQINSENISNILWFLKI